MFDSVIKIAVLLPNLNVGGAERLVLEELSHLRNDRRFFIEVHLVFEKGAMYTRLINLGLAVHVWGATHKSLRMLKTCLDISRYLRQNEFEILHCHLFDHIGPYVAKLAGIKVVSTVHSDVQCGPLVKSGLRKCDLVLGCGKKVLNNIGQFLSKEKVGLLNNAVSPKANTLKQRQSICDGLSISSKSKVILSLGRLSWEKGYDSLISAFKKLIKAIPEAVLIIGGDGEMKTCLYNQILASNLQDNVKLLGLVEDVNEILAICEVYVNSSRREGLPMTLLEAMSHGKPIVATNVGGNSEVVRDEITGLLVPPDNPDKISDALIRILTDKVLKEKLGTMSYNLFINEYTIEKHCEVLTSYYVQLAHR